MGSLQALPTLIPSNYTPRICSSDTVANAKEEAGAGNVEKAGIKIANKIAYEIAYSTADTGTGTGDILPYADPHSLSYLLGAN